jgi:hypothetical protein
MPKRFALFLIAPVAVLASALAFAQNDAQRLQNRPWNNPGWRQLPPANAAPAPRRDLSGTWDAGAAGIGASLSAVTLKEDGSPYTPLGEKLAKANRPGFGPRIALVAEINDPVVLGDPGGFPRIVLFELRPFHIAQTPHYVLMAYMWEQRWRVIWTDGRALPEDPDPRWYGYSVGRWEDDDTFVVNSVGMDDRTWLTNTGDPHSADLRVEERYRRVSQNTIELTVTLNDPAIYVKPWKPRNRLPLRLMPNGTDFMEMIPSVLEAQAYDREFASRTANTPK